MSEQLIKILYNPSSINSVEPVETGPASKSDGGEETVHGSFALIAELMRPTQGRQTAFKDLIALKRRLTLPLPTANRLALLDRFNAMLKHLASRFTDDMDIFQSAIQLVTLFKDQVEARPQNHGATLRAEWVELEKAIYVLSSWEGQLDYFWSEAN
jgi:hypothetical protein